MGVKLECDAPDCFRSADALPVPGGLRGPDGWWIIRSTGDWRCACSTAHLNPALGIPAGKITQANE